MINYRELYERQRRELAYAEERNDRYIRNHQLWEELLKNREREVRSIAIERNAAWREINEKDDRMRELQTKLDELAHELGVVMAERNQLAMTVVNAAPGKKGGLTCTGYARAVVFGDACTVRIDVPMDWEDKEFLVEATEIG